MEGIIRPNAQGARLRSQHLCKILVRIDKNMLPCPVVIEALEEDGFKVNSNPKAATPHLRARTIIRLDMMAPNGSCCTMPMSEIPLAAFYPHCDKVQSSDRNFLTQRCERQLAQITEPHSPR